MAAKNSLQAVLDRQKTEAPPPVLAQPETVTAAPKFSRPSRSGTKFVGGHFPPSVARQLRLLAAEEDTTTQALLEEALDLLFVKKGKGTIVRSAA